MSTVTLGWHSDVNATKTMIRKSLIFIWWIFFYIPIVTRQNVNVMCERNRNLQVEGLTNKKSPNVGIFLLYSRVKLFLQTNKYHTCIIAIKQNTSIPNSYQTILKQPLLVSHFLSMIAGKVTEKHSQLIYFSKSE